MATDSNPTVEKRTRFFDGQFLQDEDFKVEQGYHLDRQRRHNRLLHLPGVAEGLHVTAGEQNTVTVGPGTAIDSDGRVLVLAQDAVVDLPAERFNNRQGIELLIAYAESAEDRQTGEGSDDFTRWLERPQLIAIPPGSTYVDETPPVVLATLALDGQGRVTVDEGGRVFSGVRLPGAAADPLTLRTLGTGEVMLTGPLTVTDKLRLHGDQQVVFSDADTTNNLKVQLWTGYGLGINDGTLFYAAEQRHSWRDHGGSNEWMALTTGLDGGLTLRGTGQSIFGGPLRLFRNAQAPRGPAWFLELYQDESRRLGGDEVFPGIRFSHFWHFDTTLQARSNGFHLVGEDLSDHVDLWSRNLFARALTVGTHGPGLIGAEQPRSMVDLQAGPRTGSHPQAVPGLYVTADLGEASGGIEFRHSNGSQGIGIGYNSLYAAGSNPDQDVNIIPKGSGGVGIGRTSPWCKLDVDGDIRVQNIFVLGRMFFEPISNWGTEPEFGSRRAFWYFRRNRWNVNNMAAGGVEVHPSEYDFHVHVRREPSDLRLKENVSGISSALECVGRLRGVRFEWNAAGLRHLTRDIEETTTVGPDATEEENEELWEELRQERYEHLDVPNIGLLAQDVETIAPELVSTDGAGFKSVDYGRLSAILVEAVKELHAKVATLESKESGHA